MASMAQATPTRFDLRDVAGKNFITEVRDQGTCNSCTAYAVVAAMEGATNLKRNTPGNQLHLSEDQLFFCGGGKCDTNAWYPEVPLTYCRDTGITDFAHFQPRDQQCHTNSSWPISRIGSFQQLPDATAIKQCLTGTGPFTQASPVVTIFVLYQSFFEWAPNTANQVYRYKEKDPNEVRIGGHAVCIVGYDDHPGYWICKNSFGTGWGGAGKGFVNFSYGDCHIDDFLMYGVVVP